jgi:hypothetical protein
MAGIGSLGDVGPTAEHVAQIEMKLQKTGKQPIDQSALGGTEFPTAT